MFVSCSQYIAQLASCFSLLCRIPCWTGFAVSLHPISFWASLRRPGPNTADLYMMVSIYVCKTGIWFRSPPDRVQLTPSWVLNRVEESLRTRQGSWPGWKWEWTESSHSTLYFTLISSCALWLSSQGQNGAYSHTHLHAGAEINGCQSGSHSSSVDVCSLSRNAKGVPVWGSLWLSLPQPQQHRSIRTVQ